MDFERDGWTRVPTEIDPETLQQLRESVFLENAAGARCLLDVPLVRATAVRLKLELTGAGVLPSGAVAIQAIAFDKTPGTNWKVAWHQDLMFPFARPVESGGYELPSCKGGVDYARPPLHVLEELLAVRLHLDDCDATNGPLRVCPGSHRHGVIPSADAAARAASHGETACLADEGDAILMRPLLLHASSQATAPKHRRVLHFVYHSGKPMAEEWHRAVGA